MNSQILIIEFCRFLLMYCMAAGALFKLMNFTDFSRNLTDGFAIATPLNHVIATVLILVEASVALCLMMLPEHSNAVFFACLLLFGFFSTVLLWAAQQKRNIACHCFGQTDDKVSMTDVWRNIILVASSLPGFVFDTSEYIDIGSAIHLLTATLTLPCFLLILHFKDAVRLLRYQSAF